MDDEDAQTEPEDTTMGDEPIEVTRRVSSAGPRTLADAIRHAVRRHDRQMSEANRPTGSELARTTQRVQEQQAADEQAKDLAQQAMSAAKTAKDDASAAVQTAARAAETARSASTDAASAIGKATAAASEMEDHERRITALEDAPHTSSGHDSRIVQANVDGTDLVVSPDKPVLSVTIPPAQAPIAMLRVTVSGIVHRTGQGRLTLTLAGRDGDTLDRGMAVPVGDGAIYPGVDHTPCAVSMTTDCTIEPGTTVDLTLSPENQAAWGPNPDNHMRLTARIDY